MAISALGQQMDYLTTPSNYIEVVVVSYGAGRVERYWASGQAAATTCIQLTGRSDNKIKNTIKFPWIHLFVTID